MSAAWLLLIAAMLIVGRHEQAVVLSKVRTANSRLVVAIGFRPVWTPHDFVSMCTTAAVLVDDSSSSI